ncbi:unnamed protein product [Owenia fusiformis]|uniref:L-Fucosyltransferase n=2 Tax=Owenia fusiformis TaxID=6347 RepID=A0A8J1U0K8_OWEFU|nr:unnamed protein product [Owenia fusiformis]
MNSGNVDYHELTEVQFERELQKCVVDSYILEDMGNNKLSADSAVFREKAGSINPSTYNLTIADVDSSEAGLGNLMFMYASMYGLAVTNNRTPVLKTNHRLLKYFTLKVIKVTNQDIDSSRLENTKVMVPCCAKYFPNLCNLSPGNHQISGYLQSWKYFDFVKPDILEQFQFDLKTSQLAKEFISEIKKGLSGQITLIGVHVRRGDMISRKNIDFGHQVATTEYLKNAMLTFKQKYPKLAFVIVTSNDDLSWTKQNINLTEDVYFSENHSEIEDLAILTHCNHTIITTGTFGWWGGYLTGGTTVYFRDWPRAGSPLDKGTNHTEYFPKSWIGMS